MGLAKKKAVSSAAKKKVSKKKSSSKKIKKLSRKGIDSLIVEHRDHGRRLAWSFLSGWRIRMPQDEVVSIVGAALCEAANRFDPGREVAFKTFFFYHLRGMLLKEISRMVKQKSLMRISNHHSEEGIALEAQTSAGLDYPLMEKRTPEKLIQKKQLSNFCLDACEKLDDLEKEVLMRYFVNDQPLVDIAKNLSYCRCHISRVKSKALKKLSTYLQQALGKDIEDIDNIKMPTKKINKRALGAYKGGRGRRKRE